MDVMELVESLQEVESAVVANAVEGLELRDRTEGFTDLSLRCLSARPKPMVGFAVTFKVDSTTPGREPDHERSSELSAELFGAIGAADAPVVACIQESGPNPDRGTLMGDIFGTALARAGVVGIVSGSGVRDLAGLAGEDLWVFAKGRVVSHGVYTITEVGTPVEIAGLTIRPGDLLHGDEDGIVSVPTSQPNQLDELVRETVASETAARDRFRTVS